MDAPTIAHRRFTTQEFQQMDAAGIFGEEERLELLAGDVIEIAPPSPLHAASVTRLTKQLLEQIADWANIRLLLIEVSESSLPYDRDVKLQMCIRDRFDRCRRPVGPLQHSHVPLARRGRRRVRYNAGQEVDRWTRLPSRTGASRLRS